MIRYGVVFLLVLGSISTVAAGPPLLAIDADHPLTQESRVEQFEEDGVVSANLSRVALELTIAKSSGKADIDGFHTDLTKTYLCLDYREGIARQVRLYVPTEYFLPRKANLAPMGNESGAVATLQPVQNRSYTAVTVTLTRSKRVCYAIRKETGAYFSGKSWIADLTENATGIELPDLSGSAGAWEPISSDQVAANTTVALPEEYADPAVQYDAVAGEEQRWVNVPECSDPSDQTVCRFERNNRTYVMSPNPPHPPVRYRQQSSPSTTFKSAVNDALAAVDRLRNSIGKWFGGG